MDTGAVVGAQVILMPTSVQIFLEYLTSKIAKNQVKMNLQEWPIMLHFEPQLPIR